MRRNMPRAGSKSAGSIVFFSTLSTAPVYSCVSVDGSEAPSEAPSASRAAKMSTIIDSSTGTPLTSSKKRTIDSIVWLSDGPYDPPK